MPLKVSQYQKLLIKKFNRHFTINNSIMADWNCFKIPRPQNRNFLGSQTSKTTFIVFNTYVLFLFDWICIHGNGLTNSFYYTIRISTYTHVQRQSFRGNLADKRSQSFKCTQVLRSNQRWYFLVYASFSFYPCSGPLCAYRKVYYIHVLTKFKIIY